MRFASDRMNTYRPSVVCALQKNSYLSSILHPPNRDRDPLGVELDGRRELDRDVYRVAEEARGGHVLDRQRGLCHEKGRG